MRKKLKNTIIYLTARLWMGLVRMMSFALSMRFGRWLGNLAFRWAKTERRRTMRHLEMAFPDHSAEDRSELARSVFKHFGMAAAECINVRKIDDLTSYVEIEPRSRAVLDDVLARGLGVVFVTGHCGNWELMARTLARLGYPINTIGKKSYDPRFTRLIERFREEGAVRTIWRGDPDVVEKMANVLKRGQVMGLLIDQDTRVPGVFVPFFDRLAYTPSAAATLARQCSAPLVTGFSHRRPEGGYAVTIEEFTPCAEEDSNEAITEDTLQLTARIEQHIRQHPAEWVWMHRRWKTRPNMPDDKGLQS
jgi:KDO2-lipid IV(A) lauroyltransferase